MILSFINWDVNPEIINILGISLRYYGVLFACGLLLSIYLMNWMFKKEQVKAENLELLTIYGIVLLFVGARLVHCLGYEANYYLVHPLEMLLPIQPTLGGGYHFTGYQGLASHGGALGLILAVYLYSRKTKESMIGTLDYLGIVAPLCGGFIRLANLMNSEIIGFPTKVPWAFIFTSEDNLPRHPTQLYEAITYFLIFGLMFYLFNKKRKTCQNGVFFGLSLTLIFVARFLIEFLKERQVSFEQELTLDMGQIYSIPFILIGIGFIVYGLDKTKKARLLNAQTE